MAAPDEHPQDSKTAGERIAKVIARSGLCSRREAEGLIGDRRVSVNGAIIESAALDILPSDRVLVDGKPLSLREPPRLWRYYKPKGRVTTHKDPEGRPTVFEALPENLPRLISVGRLDFNTEGLLLLTNDGDLARHLELPATGWTRRYRVRAFGEVSEAQLQELAGGLTVSGMSYGPIEASLEREQGGNVWISISIREGKNREVRRIMEHLGLTVNRLIRVSFGPFMLGDLEPGQIEEVKTAVLKDQLGPRLSRQLGVKREPVREERRLQPLRGKPSHLRRGPATKVRDERQVPDARPLKRRRILEEGGTGTPKIEFVAEERPRRGRSGQDAGPARKPRFGGQAPDRKDGRELRASRRERVARGKPGEARHEPRGAPGARSKDAARFRHERPERPGDRPAFRQGPEAGGRTDFRRDRPGNPTPDAGARGSHRKPRDYKPFAERQDAGAGDRPRFRARRSDRPDEKQRPPRRWEKPGGEADGPRKPRPDFERQGERPPHRHGAERREGRQDFRQRPRDGSERTGESGRPPFRRPDERERKPFKARSASGDRPGNKGGGPGGRFGGGKPPHGKHRMGTRKPGHRRGPEADKDRP
jgi:23S rRNA pseudouridine2605 synthase